MTYGGSSRITPALTPPVTRAYIDAYGSMYPNAAVPVSDGALQKHDGSLYNYYQARPVDWTALLSTYGFAAGSPFGAALWDSVQTRIQSETGANIMRALGDGPTRRTLVMLIHGFNATPRPAYDSAHSLIAREYFPDGGVAFMEVHWDGYRSPVGAGAWGEGQHNSYMTGLALRRLMGEIHPDVPIRILTHSTGGAVTSAALWNVVSKSPAFLNNQKELANWRREYVEQLTHPTPPQSDIRVGMIVPAMPGCTFDDYYRPADSTYYSGSGLGCQRVPFREPFSPEDRSHYRRIVIGINENDMAIRKVFFRSGCKFAGAICLGQTEEEFKRYVAPRLNRPGQPPVAYLVNFTGSLSNRKRVLFWDKHDFDLYLRRDASKSFLDLLFGP